MFHMDGSGVFKKAVRLVGPFLDTFLAETGWQRAEIDCVVPHQASRHGVELLTARLGFRHDQVFTPFGRRVYAIGGNERSALLRTLVP